MFFWRQEQRKPHPHPSDPPPNPLPPLRPLGSLEYRRRILPSRCGHLENSSIRMNWGATPCDIQLVLTPYPALGLWNSLELRWTWTVPNVKYNVFYIFYHPSFGSLEYRLLKWIGALPNVKIVFSRAFYHPSFFNNYLLVDRVALMVSLEYPAYFPWK